MQFPLSSPVSVPEMAALKLSPAFQPAFCFSLLGLQSVKFVASQTPSTLLGGFFLLFLLFDLPTSMAHPTQADLPAFALAFFAFGASALDCKVPST